jgi:hypothetical protein
MRKTLAALTAAAVLSTGAIAVPAASAHPNPNCVYLTNLLRKTKQVGSPFRAPGPVTCYKLRNLKNQGEVWAMNGPLRVSRKPTFHAIVVYRWGSMIVTSYKPF